MCVYVNNIAYAEHIALVKGDVSKGGPVLVRMHALSVGGKRPGNYKGPLPP